VARGLVHRRGAVTAVGPLAAIGELRIAEGRAPRAGEHTRELLAELGLDPGAIAALLASRAASQAEP
jgi:crotonobetainyl-CoA:carnitine CoA-transferase CaiB-like acyl-CoA transferase